MKLTFAALALSVAAVAASAEPDYGLQITVERVLDGYNTCAHAHDPEDATRAMMTGTKWTSRAMGKYNTLVSMGKATSEDTALLELMMSSTVDCIAHAINEGWVELDDISGGDTTSELAQRVQAKLN